MRRSVSAVVLIVLLAAAAAAQSDDFFEHRSDHYLVLSEFSADHAESTADMLEAYFQLFNSYFRFDPAELSAPLRVRVFSSQARSDRYLTRLISETRDNFVYLHYNNPERSELVGYLDNAGDTEVSMVHQSFIQYLRAFVPNPPLWLREGFAVFFENAVYDPEFDAVVHRENLSWLDTLQDIVLGETSSEPIPFDQLLRIDLETARQRIDVFYPQAWGAVSFLLNSSDREHNRILWDSISALEPQNSLAQNIAAIEDQVLRFVDEDLLIADFVSYVEDRRSFRGLIEDGIAAYDAQNLDQAEQAFVTALNLRQTSFIPYYYLGLINYDRANYSLAEFYYQSALERGVEQATVYYALGVNAFADNRFDDAEGFLRLTQQLDPDGFGVDAGELLERIQSQS